MIRILQEPPECFRHVTAEGVFLEHYNKDGLYAYTMLEFDYTVAGFHLEISRWSPSVLKSLKKDWWEILDICEARGVKKLLAQNTATNDQRWARFIKHFGFPEPIPLLISAVPIEEVR
jgi:hypothetical protein